jgi:O-acetylhomoserine (thiol)-lyase
MRGLESLHVRYPRHLSTAQTLARELSRLPGVSWVNHPSIPTHRSHENAKTYFSLPFGGVLAFGLKGGFQSCRTFIDTVKLLSHTTNIGDTKTLVIHPASTTHRNVDPQKRREMGLGDDLIRMSVGLEDPQDLLRAIQTAIPQ